MLSPGTRIDDRYEVLDALGSGGMGHVYRAKRVRLGDEVAIKVMQATPAASPDLHERFLRESRACAQLRHPNIVAILDFGVDASKQPYMAMELLSGPSLREEIELEAPMAPSRVAAILAAVASALDLAHGRGITHRDLKPANIVVHQYESGERVYKVIDFGLASMKAGNDETRLTDPNFFLGTLAYAAPEQISGGEISPATDVYALGVIAYEMLTGGRPFDGANRARLVNQVMTTQPVSPGTTRTSLPPALDAAVMKALAKEPSQRYSSASEFASALEAIDDGAAAGTGVAATDTGLLARYELGPLLGRGRLGSLIYRATHRTLGLPVAIRIIKRDEQPHWEAVRARFLLEARTLQVVHPGLSQARDFEEDERLAYLVTDLIEGPSLRQALAEAGCFPWPRARALLEQALDAVAALHRSGGFIAGVNPDMIRLRGGAIEQIIMSCAGIRSVQDVLSTMREQELRGEEASEHELPYVPPEILMGGPPSVRADVFTIGVLAYQMVTGQPAFRAPSLPELIGQMLQVKPVAPSAIVPTLPAAANDAILRSIDAVPASRFESTSEFLGALTA